MAVPRNRSSNARKHARRSHNARKPKNLATCANCQAACLPHSACNQCGQYKGAQVVRKKD